MTRRLSKALAALRGYGDACYVLFDVVFEAAYESEQPPSQFGAACDVAAPSHI